MPASSSKWWQRSWNPVTGCSPVSEGCDNCWAERMARRLQKRGDEHYANGFAPTCHSDRLDQPLRYPPGESCAVGLMGDVCHEAVPDWFLGLIFMTMARAAQNPFFVLTKRPHRLTNFVHGYRVAPLQNIWLGTSLEHQGALFERMGSLRHLACRGWPTFISVEPLLGPVRGFYGEHVLPHGPPWVIVGAETGPGRRPCQLEWVESIVDQCQRADTLVFVKQVHINGRVSHDPDEWPESIRVRQHPEGVHAP